MDRLVKVSSQEDIFPEYRETPIGQLFEYHNLRRPFDSYNQAQLLLGLCMDYRENLQIPENFAYILRSGGEISVIASSMYPIVLLWVE